MADSNRNREKATDNAQQYVYARDAGHLDFVRKARKCLDFVDSYGDKQWDEVIANRLRSQGKPVLTIGKIFPTMAVIMGEQINNQVDIAFRSTPTGTEGAAKALDVVWMHVINSNQYQYIKADAFDSGIITSRGYVDVRMSFEDNIKGDIKLSEVNPTNVVLDSDASKYDPDEWSQVFTTEWQTIDAISRLYGDRFSKELSSRPGSAFAYGGADFMDYPVDTFGKTMGFQNLVHGPNGAKLRRFIRTIERQYVERKKMPHFIERTTGETRPIPVNWNEDRITEIVQQTGLLVADLMGKVLRWTVSADDLLLHDAISPYEHFTLVPYYPVLTRGRTIGLVEGLVSSQEGLNKARSQELHILGSTANSGWKIKEDSLRNMDIPELEERGAEQGLVMELRDPADAEKIAPNQVPSGFDRVAFKFDEDIKNLSNVGPGMTSTAREDASGKALKQQEVRGTISLARPLMNLIRTDELVARNVLSLVQRYYTDERVISVVGNDAKRTEESVTINQVEEDGSITNDLTMGEYAVVSTTVPQREQHEDTVFDQAVAMKELGISVPDEVIISNSRLPNKSELLDSLEPSEEEKRMKEIELETAEAELDKLKTENMDRRASAVDKIARARRTAMDDPNQQSGGGDEGGQEALAFAQLELERHKVERELALQERIADEKIALEREKMRRETRLKERDLKIKEKVASANAKKPRAA